MPIEKTLSIVKPDAVARNLIGKIYSRFESNGLKIVASRMMTLSQDKAEGFYAEHKGKPFFETLIQFMTSGPIVVQVLEGEDAIELNRKIMGKTDPEKADEGTIRKDFAESMQRNSVHGSDSSESAAREIAYFFEDADICSR